MKKLILLLFICISCNQNNVEKQLTDKEKHIFDTLKTKLNVKNKDKFDTINNVIDILQKSKFNKYGDSPVILINKIKINKNQTIFLFNETTSICNREFLCLYNNILNRIECILLVKEYCDTELSFFEHVELDYLLINNDEMKIYKFSEKIKNLNFVDNKGWIKDGLTREDLEVERDTLEVKIEFSKLKSKQLSTPQIKTILDFQKN